MKLRFRGNSLRLRVNQKEVESLAEGLELAEKITFGGGATLSYVLAPVPEGTPSSVKFDGTTIRVSTVLRDWARGDEIGLYFYVEPGLKVSVEKDLECVDGGEDEKDPHAFPRKSATC